MEGCMGTGVVGALGATFVAAVGGVNPIPAIVLVALGFSLAWVLAVLNRRC
jgi:hypothetical protein